jgi:hypothetical protein
MHRPTGQADPHPDYPLLAGQSLNRAWDISSLPTVVFRSRRRSATPTLGRRPGKRRLKTGYYILGQMALLDRSGTVEAGLNHSRILPSIRHRICNGD